MQDAQTSDSSHLNLSNSGITFFLAWRYRHCTGCYQMIDAVSHRSVDTSTTYTG